MRLLTIQQLAHTLPPETEYGRGEPGPVRPDHSVHMAAVQRFALCYSDLSFGWKYASEMARCNRPIPGFLRGDDWIVSRAWWYIKGVYDPIIAQAEAINCLQMRAVKRIVEGGLVNPSRSLETIAYRAGVSLEVLKVHEKLFFNIIDRRHEAAFLASVVYPDSRLVELRQNYLEDADVDALIKRMGMNASEVEYLHFSGLNDAAAMAALSQSPDVKAILEKRILVNALIMTQSGLMNQSAVPGLSRATTLMSAEKQGGEAPVAEGGNPFDTMGEALRNEMVRAGLDEGARQAELRNQLLAPKDGLPDEAKP